MNNDELNPETTNQDTESSIPDGPAPVYRDDSKAARAGAAAGRVVGGIVNVGARAASFLGNRFKPDEGEEPESFEDYAWSTKGAAGDAGAVEELDPGDPMEDDEDLPEIDGTENMDEDVTEEDVLGGNDEDTELGSDPFGESGTEEAIYGKPEPVDMDRVNSDKPSPIRRPHRYMINPSHPVYPTIPIVGSTR